MLIAREVALDEPQEPDENTEKQHEREDVEHLHPRQRVGVGSQNAGSAPPVAALTKQPSQKLGKEVFQFPLLSNAAQRRCGASPPRGHGGTHDFLKRFNIRTWGMGLSSGRGTRSARSYPLQVYNRSAQIVGGRLAAHGRGAYAYGASVPLRGLMRN